MISFQGRVDAPARRKREPIHHASQATPLLPYRSSLSLSLTFFSPPLFPKPKHLHPSRPAPRTRPQLPLSRGPLPRNKSPGATSTILKTSCFHVEEKGQDGSSRCLGPLASNRRVAILETHRADHRTDSPRPKVPRCAHAGQRHEKWHRVRDEGAVSARAGVRPTPRTILQKLGSGAKKTTIRANTKAHAE